MNPYASVWSEKQQQFIEVEVTNNFEAELLNLLERIANSLEVANARNRE
jgi:hypothetical protein